MLAVGLVMIIAIGVVVFFLRSSPNPPARTFGSMTSINDPHPSPASPMHSSAQIQGGGVKLPAFQSSETSPATDPQVPDQPPVIQPPIHSPSEAIQGHIQPAAVWGPAEEYNDAYFVQADPGRIQQTRPLKEGEVLPVIQIAGPGFQWALPGALCEQSLRVKIPPNMPCSFYAEDWGTFQNGKNCITVKADAEGMAEAFYTAPESKGGSMVLAHSPEAMGTARFSIKVVSEEELVRIQNMKESTETNP